MSLGMFFNSRQLLITHRRLIVLNSVLFIFSLFLIVCLLLPVQLYGSTTLCDPSLNLTNRLIVTRNPRHHLPLIPEP